MAGMSCSNNHATWKHCGKKLNQYFRFAIMLLDGLSKGRVSTRGGKMRLSLLMTFWLGVLQSGTAVGGDCSVCLGPNLSVALSEHPERLYLTIGDSPPIYFYKPQKPPLIVCQGLDRNRRYAVKVYFDDKIVRSRHLDFRKLKSNMAYINSLVSGPERNNPMIASLSRSNKFMELPYVFT